MTREKQGYYKYWNEEITKDLLDTVRVGDLIKFNEWTKAFRVVGVSENYFLMTKNVFSYVLYSICEKKQKNGVFRCGPDSWVFAPDYSYKFDDNISIKEYLNDLEAGETELSDRSSIEIKQISFKHDKEWKPKN